MIPGEIKVAAGDIELNKGTQDAVRLDVAEYWG